MDIFSLTKTLVEKFPSYRFVVDYDSEERWYELFIESKLNSSDNFKLVIPSKFNSNLVLNGVNEMISQRG